MTATATSGSKSGRSNGAATTVGKRGPERQGQPKEVRKTPTGKFGQRLGELMAKANLSTEEFADRIGVTSDAVRKYLRGDNVPNIDKWPQIASVLGLKDARDLVPNLPV